MKAILLTLILASQAVLHAAEFGDKRDKPGEVQKLLVPRELIPSSAPRTAEEELKSFQIAPGFRIELVAGDPLVQDPVAMQIGPDGRMWVVEMRGFMADLDGVKEAEPVGDVAVLEDTDGDGRMDKRAVFQDGLIMPRALLLVGDGVLVGAPPHLWFCRDTNGDGKADEKKEIAGNFGMQSDPVRPEVANPEQAPNSLLWANDNWIYAAHWTRKFRYDGGQWTNGVATFRGQWGLTQDNDGHFFYNSNQDPLRTDILPSHYTGRNPNHVPCGGVNVQVYTDQFVWPVRVNPGINRGYRDGILRENYRLKEFTAACAPCIYRGGLFPTEFDGNAFICEPAGNLIKREIITAKDGTLTCMEAYDQREFLASTDERFRPVNLYTGPEGALYVTDLYRGVLQHRESFTTYLRKYIEERGLDQPQHLGRIWRIVPDRKTPLIKPDLHRQAPAQWVEHLSHSNNWWRETAQRLLVVRNDTSVVSALQTLALKGKSSLGRVHALWTLEGMGRLDPETVLAALKDENARVRAAAVRVSETFLKNEHRAKVLPQLIAMTNEDAPFVQQQLVLTLSEASDKDADHAVAALVKHAASTAFIQDAALSGLAGRELALLDHLLSDKESSPSDKFLSALARCIFGLRNSTQVESLLELVVAHPEHAKTLTAGILETKAITGRKPVKFKTEPAALKQLNNSAIAALLTWPGKPGSKPEPPVIPLTAAQQTRHDLGKVLFNGICAACHQPHGLGLEGVAPPLVDSEWVLGSEQRLVCILLHGVTGPLSVKGRTYRLDMPAMGVFTDDQLSGILTYIRREWEHNAAPVEPETVKAIRAATAERHEAWLGEQLLEIDSPKSASATPALRTIESTFHVEKLAKLDAMIAEAIRESKVVGAALWVERDGVAYHKAFGMRALTPKPEAMTEDTIFDIASITKVAATASAAMLCVERGMTSLDDPVSKHLGEFIGEGREKITIKHLLLHTSGLEVNLNGSKTPYSRSPAEAFAQACREKPTFEPGTAFSYSSVGSMVLGTVIERLTGRTLDSFCTTEIFRPLKMRDTLFRPSGEILRRVAPSSAPERGQVDDFVARHMGGIAGHASLFTTTSDLARFARMMINRGELDGVRIFKPETINLMTSVQSPADLRSPGAKNLPVRRALGWDIDTPYRTPPHDYTLSRGGLFPVGGYGHTGWTGQMLWIDPFSRTTVIFLCNRYGPDGKDTRPEVYQLHRRLSTLAAEAVRDFDFKNVPGALAPARISQPNKTQP